MESKNNKEELAIIDSTDKIDMFYMLKLISDNRIFVLTSTFLTGVLSIIYVLVVNPIYESVVTMYPNKEGSANPFSGLIQGYGIANKIGVFHIPEVIKSRRIADEITLKKYKTKAFKDSVNLIQYWHLEELYDKKEFQLEAARRILAQQIRIRDDKETFLITVFVRMPERKLAADIANYTGIAVTNYLQSEEHRTLIMSRKYLQKRFRETKKRLTEVEQELIDFKEKNFVQNSPKLNAELIRHDRKFRIAQDVYIMISKQLELMLLEEVRIKPVVAILDTANITFKPVYPKKRYIVILNTFAVFFLTVIIVAMKQKYYTAENINKLKDAIRK